MERPGRISSRLLLALGLLAAGCRAGVPVLDTGAPPPEVNGTISGTVRGPGGTAPAVGRTVRAVALDTGRVFEVETGSEGAYSIEVPPGRYRIEVTLLEGERILEQPDDTSVNPSDVDDDRDFVIAGGERPGA